MPIHQYTGAFNHETFYMLMQSILRTQISRQIGLSKTTTYKFYRNRYHFEYFCIVFRLSLHCMCTVAISKHNKFENVCQVQVTAARPGFLRSASPCLFNSQDKSFKMFKCRDLNQFARSGIVSINIKHFIYFGDSRRIPQKHSSRNIALISHKIRIQSR